jgi:hypothetical protein
MVVDSSFGSFCCFGGSAVGKKICILLKHLFVINVVSTPLSGIKVELRISIKCGVV